MTAAPVIGICVPTIREDALRRFLHEWLPFWNAERAYEVRLFIHEDNPLPTFRVPPSTTLPYVHTSHADLEVALGDASWIIPKHTAACRSFPMYLAWKDGCDFIVTMDDDCYPNAGEGATFLARHVAAFTQDRWFRTIGGDEPRGIPYTRLGSLPVMVNHGLWTQTPDLDGPTSLMRHRDPRPVHLPRGHNVVPPGMAFPLCAMNVCYRREVIPAAYNLLMGVTDYGFDRFDDIWSGLLLKRVLDYSGWYATSGDPVVTHYKASNPFANLRKEAGALEVHEHLWDFVLDAPLPPGLDLRGAYRALATRVRVFPEHVSVATGLKDYFGRLADAMLVWVGLFEDAQSATGTDSFDRLHKQRTDSVE
jgi:hypothetical protein